MSVSLARFSNAGSLQLEIAHLKEQLPSRTKALLGDSSERRPSSEQKNGERKEPRPGHGPRQQKELPIVEVVHELDEPDQACRSCGGHLQPMTGQFEEAAEIDVVERSFQIVRHKRQKYRCRCGAGIETALGPEKLVPGGRSSTRSRARRSGRAPRSDWPPSPHSELSSPSWSSTRSAPG
jgi:transposase